MSRSCLYITINKFNKAIEKLPHDPNNIRFFFKNEGIKGKIANTKHCPIQKYLERESGITGLFVYPDTMYVMYGNWPLHYTHIILENPFWIRQFIDRFDEGKYPELVEK